MKILYVSVHQILEFDEISIFARLGHDVFSLGSYFGSEPSEQFRPLPPLMAESSHYAAAFHEMGGRYRYGAPASDLIIPSDFVAMFDVVVVMHDLDFIETHWEVLVGKRVIWRSIGVGTDLFEPRAARLRNRGVLIVRYCPTEARADHYAGHDAVIRFGKVSTNERWTGGRPEILTFSHAYRQRFPREYDFYLKATEGFDALLGGDGNGETSGALGVVDFQEQNRLFATCAAYFYASGSCIPYTLNFMEAWMTGIPLVAVDCRSVYAPDQCKFAEIPKLIQNGINGILVETPKQAADAFRLLKSDHTFARQVGARGAEAAKSFFSFDAIAPQWNGLLASVA